MTQALTLLQVERNGRILGNTVDWRSLTQPVCCTMFGIVKAWSPYSFCCTGVQPQNHTGILPAAGTLQNIEVIEFQPPLWPSMSGSLLHIVRVFARGVSSSTTAQGHYALQKEEDAGGRGKWATPPKDSSVMHVRIFGWFLWEHCQLLGRRRSKEIGQGSCVDVHELRSWFVHRQAAADVVINPSQLCSLDRTVWGLLYVEFCWHRLCLVERLDMHEDVCPSLIALSRVICTYRLHSHKTSPLWQSLDRTWPLRVVLLTICWHLDFIHTQQAAGLYSPPVAISQSYFLRSHQVICVRKMRI